MAFPNNPTPTDEALSDLLFGKMDEARSRAAAKVARVHMAPAQPKYRRVLRPWVLNLCWAIALAPVFWLLFQTAVKYLLWVAGR